MAEEEAAAAPTTLPADAAVVDDGAEGPRIIQPGEWLVLHMGDGRHFFAQAAAKGCVRTHAHARMYVYVAGMRLMCWFGGICP